MSFFAAHKPGQARLSRMVALSSGLFMIAWGCRSLLRTVGNPTKLPSFARPWNEVLSSDVRPGSGWRVDLLVLDEPFSPAFTVAAVLAIVLGVFWWRLLNRPRWADLLIDMETELRKVSWPSPSDAWQSTLVVAGFTVAIVLTILGYDLAIKGIIELFLNVHV